MKLKDQVCSLELAKELKALGVKQESAFYWRLVNGQLEENAFISRERYSSTIGKELASAFTVAELGEILPGYIDVGIVPGQLRRVLVIGKTIINEWRIDYQNKDFGEPFFVTGVTETDARARMVILLIKKGYLQP